MASKSKSGRKPNPFIDDAASLSGTDSGDESEGSEGDVDGLINDEEDLSQGSPPSPSAFQHRPQRHSKLGPSILAGLKDSDSDGEDERDYTRLERVRQKKVSRGRVKEGSRFKRQKTSSSSSSSSSSSELQRYMLEQTRGLDDGDMEEVIGDDFLDQLGSPVGDEDDDEEQVGFFSPPNEEVLLVVDDVQEEDENLGIGAGKDKELPLLKTKSASFADRDARETCYSLTLQGPVFQKMLKPGTRLTVDGWAEAIGLGPPTIAKRIANSKTLCVAQITGQWEMGEEGGNLHYQAFLKMTTIAHGKKEGKISCAVLAGKLQECIADDAYWNSPLRGDERDLETWGGKTPQHFFLQSLHANGSSKALIDYCTSGEKRFFGVPHTIGRFAKVGHGGTELRQGGVYDQFAALIANGGSYADCVNHAGGAALMQIRNLNTAISLRNEQTLKESLKVKPGKCSNAFCHLHHVNDDQTARWAEKMNVTVEVMKQKLSAPCEIQTVFVFGPGGTGKSTFTEMAGGGSFFLKPPGPWWGTAGVNGYDGQESVVMHDLDSKSFNTLGEIKNCFDCKHTVVPLKGSHATLVAKRYYLDSNYDLLEWIEMVHGTNILSKWDYSALQRRFDTLYQITMNEDGTWETTRVRMKIYEAYSAEHVVREEVRRNNNGTRMKVEPPAYTYDVVPMVNGVNGYRTQVLQGQDAAFDALFPSL